MRVCVFTLLLVAVAGTARGQEVREPVTIPSGVPLHVVLTRTAKLRRGAAVEGVLAEPIFVRDRLVLPVGAPVHGTVTEYAPVARRTRAEALLNGDVTPLHAPVVDFTSVHVTVGDSEEDVPLDSRAVIRNSAVVRFIARKQRPSLWTQAKDMARMRVTDTLNVFVAPHKKDRALEFVYGQLPYHPQRIWVGTQFVADLNAAAVVELPQLAPAAEVTAPSLDGLVVEARLAETIDSKGARKGDTVEAIVTRPVFDAEHHMVLPEGAGLEGVISAAKPARSFGRNGALRFAIRGVAQPGGEQQHVYGTLTAAEGAKGENVTVDAEGNVQANPDKNRFVAPLLLAASAALGNDEDNHHGHVETNTGGDTVASNGFGVIARIVALTASSDNVAMGFGYYALAKSVYFRFLTRGHEVTFPKDTEVEVELSVREKTVSH